MARTTLLDPRGTRELGVPGEREAAADLVQGGDGHAVDPDAYCARIRYGGGRRPTAATLRGLQRAHTAAVCFENADIALGRDIPLDIASLERKLVHAGRGGYCFEQNLFFAAVLEQLGFPVTRHLARVRRGGPGTRYRSHVVLLVEADGRTWLCDVGFGDEGPLEPLPFTPGARLTVGDWTWRLDREEAAPARAGLDGGAAEWVLRSARPDGWFDVYALRLERQEPADFEVAHYYTAHHPDSFFTGRLVAQRGDEHVRHTLTDRVLKARYADGRVLRTDLAPDEVVHVLRGTFGITLTAEESLLLQQRVASFHD
ncbi:arylamine N-acetyltransferase [Streptomyces gamaensis]|uniref:Arylamine N-acetyltransferase n=1 Tax=Streptomyces gamaensis TaxID=1763542 RepID=A0ABW0Z471_9ACTN